MYYDNFMRMQSHMYFKSHGDCKAFLLECKNRKFFVYEVIFSTLIHSGKVDWDVTGFYSMLSLIFFAHSHVASFPGRPQSLCYWSLRNYTGFSALLKGTTMK